METMTSDPRRQRGLEIAARHHVVRRGGGWSVPSQSGMGKYTVTGISLATGVGASRCSCPDWELRGGKCKHVWAVEHVIARAANADGSTTVTETVHITKTVKRTYTQN